MIEEITSEEFYSVRKGKTLAPELVAVRALQPGQAIKFPCRWPHGRGCQGAAAAHITIRKMNFKIQTSCVDKILRVQRLPA